MTLLKRDFKYDDPMGSDRRPASAATFGGGAPSEPSAATPAPNSANNPLALFGNYNGPGGYQDPKSLGPVSYASGNTEAQVSSAPAGQASNSSAGAGGAVFGGTAPQGAGLIGGAINNGAQSWQVTAPQTVESRAAGIINQDGPLMQQARGFAMQKANERGLINSSLGIQAAQDAVTGRAVDIARQDAATAADAAKFNVNQGNSWSLAQQELAQKGGQFDRQLNSQSSQFDRDLQYRYDAAKSNNENAASMAALENKYRTQLQNDSAFNKQYEIYVDALYRIDNNKDLDAQAKAVMKQEQARILEDYAKVRGLGLNLDFSQRYTAPASAPQPGSTDPQQPPTPTVFQPGDPNPFLGNGGWTREGRDI
jgi:hypothetical protein